MGRLVNKLFNVSAFMAIPDTREKKHYNRLLRNIALLLQKANVDFGYLYAEEMYSGALAHDEGAQNTFKRHAEKVFSMFKRNAVKRVITVDPHTTNMLRSVYPDYIEGYDLEVKSYLEVLAKRDISPSKISGSQVILHDSCVYARYENTIKEPRALLKKAGITVKEPELSGKMTFCCGGPVESLFPSKAHAIAEKRIQQLADGDTDIVTMCPICLVNLKHEAEKKSLNVKDISEYLVSAYC